MARTLTLPGFVNVHSHGFQRALRGRAAGADFWAWRETMLAEAERQTPQLVRTEYEGVYREQLAAGYTAVGEFHYLGYAEALAAAAAAEAAGVELVLLYAAYGRGGIDRFRQESVGLVSRRRRAAARRPGYASGSRPTRFGRAHATGSRRSAATPLPPHSRYTSTPASSRARSRSVSPSTG